jgi:sulfur relay (sulfurtransferase) DsrC/TusE family protein
MPSKQKVVVSFAEKIGIMDVSYMSETAQRLEAHQSLIFYQKKPHDNVIRLSREENVELIESPNPRQEIKTINERFGKDKYDIIMKNLEDMRASMMDPC